jgi:hypothetical protein
MYFHDPLNNQVTISDVPQGDQATSAAQFLSGRGNLTREALLRRRDPALERAEPLLRLARAVAREQLGPGKGHQRLPCPGHTRRHPLDVCCSPSGPGPATTHPSDHASALDDRGVA